ncbi:ecdysteroid 22-kinase family protein [[Mycobacterium] nativiensis]|uniref:Phosphotransferase n=1 Tax=[Mycobacterium] nativiensis TaxID=2855503 RepID=A0ABU5Y2I5_9MYCO|nr:ecdysteroid 22-kinase family protein [Mycolicibacter sp. MYC340]MEB3034390.1 phosphotransferase [Mycolicibacter sp. MYC340]
MQTHHDAAPIESPSDLTPEWLTAVLGGTTVTGFRAEQIGTGQMSECYRLSLDYAQESSGPPSLVLKVAAREPTSRQTGLTLGLYQREVGFYTDIAPRLSGPISHCYHAAIDTDTGIFDLLLEDAAPAKPGDDIAGATVDQALLAVSELGRMHSSLQADTDLAGVAWLNRESPINQALITALYAGFLDRYAGRITDEQRTVCDRLVNSFDAYVAAEEQQPHGLVHGDYRLDNMLLGEAGAARALTVVDWQTVTWAPAFVDLAYFLGCALPVEVRRANSAEFIEAYLAGRGPEAGVTAAEVRDGLRRQSFFGVMMAIVSSMLVGQTERGDDMFMTMLARHCAQVLDTDALAVLPAPAVPDPLVPAESDEHPHPPAPEPLWNESWYFDFVDEGGQIGGWIRLGLYPNENHAWVNALLCGPGMPTVALNDFRAELPADPFAVSTAGITLTQQVIEPLRRYRVTVTGEGQAYDDPAGLLRNETGRPARLSMDLQWTTVGRPYQYRITPRFEIPCTVTGSVTVNGTTHAISAVPGQRDHSWGVRDWWGMDWVWSALHLDDGTQLHGVDVRIPGMPPVGIGYVQDDAGLTELQSVSAEEAFGADDLPVSTMLRLQPTGLVANAEIIAHAPVRLESADGRISQFPRAWARITMADGRTGVGWLEWNRNR